MDVSKLTSMLGRNNQPPDDDEEEKKPVEHEEEIQQAVDKFAKKANGESDNPDFHTKQYYDGMSDLLWTMWGVDASSEFAKRVSMLRAQGKLRDYR